MSLRNQILTWENSKVIEMIQLRLYSPGTRIQIVNQILSLTFIVRDFTRGILPVNTKTPHSMDFTSGHCQSAVRDDQTNSGSASAVITAVEHCLCQAANSHLTPRSVQQV